MPLDPQDLSFVGSVTVRGSVEEEVRILFRAFKENPVGHSNFHMQLDTQKDEVKVSVVCHTAVNCCILVPHSVFHLYFFFVT